MITQYQRHLVRNRFRPIPRRVSEIKGDIAHEIRIAEQFKREPRTFEMDAQINRLKARFQQLSKL